MNPRLLFAFCCLVVMHGSAAIGLEVKPDPAVESVLAKWNEAATQCHSLDATVSAFIYDRLIDKEPQRQQGRIYYEAPDEGRIDLQSAGGPLTQGSTMLWRRGEFRLIDWKDKTCIVVPVSGPGRPEHGFWGWLYPIMPARPQAVVPLLLDVPDDQLRSRFNFRRDPADNQILLEAVPRRRDDQRQFERLYVLLDSKSNTPFAVQRVTSGQFYAATYVLSDMKVNQRPADRDQLMNPDLDGLKLERWCAEATLRR